MEQFHSRFLQISTLDFLVFQKKEKYLFRPRAQQRQVLIQDFAKIWWV